MRIIKTHNWLRRDFDATMECQECGNIHYKTGCYDDANYYQNVVPSFKCPACKKSSNDIGCEIEKVTPKYPSSLII